MSKVQILLSTYNGEKYIKEQVNSLLNQINHEITLLIRDDGSTDNTLLILQEYENKFDNIKVIAGDNLGVVKSFFSLVNHSNETMDYFAFCDQDDFWNKEKVSKAIDKMREIKTTEKPIMYCSATTLVDEELKFLKSSALPKRELCIKNALVENIATGCTIVMNNDLIRKIRGLDYNYNRILMHDWWIYQVASILGSVVYDSESNILYRQHSNNVVGGNVGMIKLYKNRIIRFRKNQKKNLLTLQAMELKRIYGTEIIEKDLTIINDFINREQFLIGRFKYALNTRLYRQSRIDNFLFRVLLVVKVV